jgi:hypothetical protein
MYSVALLKSIAKGGIGWYAALRKVLRNKQSRAKPKTQPAHVKTVAQTVVPTATVAPATNNSAEVPIASVIEPEVTQANTEAGDQGAAVPAEPTDSKLETEAKEPEQVSPVNTSTTETLSTDSIESNNFTSASETEMTKSGKERKKSAGRRGIKLKKDI